MKPMNTRQRIKSALKLQPMTVKTLALCLSMSLRAVYRALHALSILRAVRCLGFDARKGRQPILWGLV